MLLITESNKSTLSVLLAKICMQKSWNLQTANIKLQTANTKKNYKFGDMTAAGGTGITIQLSRKDWNRKAVAARVMNFTRTKIHVNQTITGKYSSYTALES